MNDDTKQSRHPQPARALEWLSAAVVGAGSGFAGLAANARSKFHGKLMSHVHRNSKDADFLAALEKGLGDGDKRAAATKELFDIAKNHACDLQSVWDDTLRGVKSSEDFLKESPAIKNISTKAYDAWMGKHLGIKSEGLAGYFRGTIQRLQYLGNNTRTPIIFAAITGTTVGAAATMMFFNSLHTRERLDTIADNVKR